MRHFLIIASILTSLWTHANAATSSFSSLKTVDELKSENSDYANLIIGLYYEFGYLVKQDFNKAKIYYESSKHPFALVRQGFLFNSGYGVKIDFRKANEYYIRSEKSEDIPEYSLVLEKTQAYNSLSEILYINYMQEEDRIGCESAISRLEELSETGNVWALYSLGHAYASNSGVKCKNPDDERAKSYYLAAAEQGHPQSMNNLSVTLDILFSNPFSKTQQKNKESLFWLKKAAEAGVILSQTNLGLEYMWGDGKVERDEQEGIYWLNEAISQGSSKAKMFLGHSYLWAIEIKNIDKGLKYLQDAAKKGECGAEYELSQYYIYLVSDLDKAKLHFYKSQELGCEDFNNLKQRFDNIGSDNKD